MPKADAKTILIVDDEDLIRDVTKSILETGGYEVLVASNGKEAISIFAEHSNHIDLVLTDMVMPEMDGISALGVIKKMKSDVKAIAVTAHIDNARYIDLLGDVDAVLRKPFDMDMLLNTIQRVLAETPRLKKAL